MMGDDVGVIEGVVGICEKVEDVEGVEGERATDEGGETRRDL